MAFPYIMYLVLSHWHIATIEDPGWTWSLFTAMRTMAYYLIYGPRGWNTDPANQNRVLFEVEQELVQPAHRRAMELRCLGGNLQPGFPYSGAVE
jgi:hypothetical protein